MNGPATKCYLTEQTIAKFAAANGGMLSIETGAHLIKQGMLATKESTNTNLQQVVSNSSPLNWFNQEIYLSHNKIRPWQKALHVDDEIINQAWTLLSFSDQQIFLASYLKEFLQLSGAIPLANAIKILSLLESK